MLGADVVVLERASLVLREDDHLARPFGEPLEHPEKGTPRMRASPASAHERPSSAIKPAESPQDFPRLADAGCAGVRPRTPVVSDRTREKSAGLSAASGCRLCRRPPTNAGRQRSNPREVRRTFRG